MQTRSIAGISLAVMAAGFVISLFLPNVWFLFLLKGGFEAGLVGGIADWFAVTALFRHPLGLRIPHTSLLLRNKKKIVDALIKAVEEDMLSRASIESKLRELRLLQRGAALLAGLLRRRGTRQALLDDVIRLAGNVPVGKAVQPVKNWLGSSIRELDVQAAAERLLTTAFEARYDEQAFDWARQEALNWIERPDTARLLGKLASDKLSAVRTGGFAGFALQAFAGFMDEDKLGTLLQSMLRSAVQDASDPRTRCGRRSFASCASVCFSWRATMYGSRSCA